MVSPTDSCAPALSGTQPTAAPSTAAGGGLCSSSPSSPELGPQGHLLQPPAPLGVAAQEGAVVGSQHHGGERQPGRGGDAAPPTRGHSKRRLHPWPDILSGFGVKGVKNQAVGRRAGVGSCAHPHHDVLPLLREAHGQTEKTTGFRMKRLLCCACIKSSCEPMGG